MNKARNRTFQSAIVEHRWRKEISDTKRYFRRNWTQIVLQNKTNINAFYRNYPILEKDAFISKNQKD